MNQLQIAQTIHWLNEFTRLSNSFFEKDNEPLHEYWKGQVMGMCKVIPFATNEIDVDYYLKKLI